uniref:Laminin EGF-like domain-containing protein n=2 Tax=Parascaris univalens TaxID=6257 RepID=A0A915AWW3_PARUN
LPTRPLPDVRSSTNKTIMSRCMPNYQGDNCEWPVCGSHGRINVITHLCECYANFAPPFCEHCIDGFWGQQCTFSTVTAIDERSLTFLPQLRRCICHNSIDNLINDSSDKQMGKKDKESRSTASIYTC